MIMLFGIFGIVLAGLALAAVVDAAVILLIVQVAP